jgi:hypothetical protein
MFWNWFNWFQKMLLLGLDRQGTALQVAKKNPGRGLRQGTASAVPQMPLRMGASAPEGQYVPVDRAGKTILEISSGDNVRSIYILGVLRVLCG